MKNVKELLRGLFPQRNGDRKSQKPIEYDILFAGDIIATRISYELYVLLSEEEKALIVQQVAVYGVNK